MIRSRRGLAAHGRNHESLWGLLVHQPSETLPSGSDPGPGLASAHLLDQALDRVGHQGQGGFALAENLFQGNVRVFYRASQVAAQGNQPVFDLLFRSDLQNLFFS